MIYLYCDGSIKGGNGGWAVGGWVRMRNGEVVAQGVVDLGRHSWNTNNLAEHAAVTGGMQALLRDGITLQDVVVRSDSQLVVNQLANAWQCVDRALRMWRDKTWALAQQRKGSVTYEWVPREENTLADAQSRTLYP